MTDQTKPPEKADALELLPCPFCGGDHLYVATIEGAPIELWAVTCVTCGGMITRATEAEAITAWNTRASPGSREAVLPSFEDAWAKYVAQGYQYGRDALENVEFGYRIASEELAALSPTAFIAESARNTSEAGVREAVLDPEMVARAIHQRSQLSYLAWDEITPLGKHAFMLQAGDYLELHAAVNAALSPTAFIAESARNMSEAGVREAVLEEAARTVEVLNGLIWARVAAREIRALKSPPTAFIAESARNTSEAGDAGIGWEEVAKHAQSLLDCLAQCTVQSGVCCCGDDMERHSNPMDCGHSPVDSGAYYTDQAAEALRAALTSTTEPEEKP